MEKTEENGGKEKTDENSGHYVIASSRLPEQHYLNAERRAKILQGGPQSGYKMQVKPPAHLTTSPSTAIIIYIGSI